MKLQRRLNPIVFSFWSLAFIALFLVPEAVFAGGITEFSTPFEKVINTITGKVGMYISVAGMAVCGIVYIFSRQDMGEGFKFFLQVMMGICFIAFASSIVNSIFSFSGAVI